jgi:uncharacterized protein
MKILKNSLIIALLIFIISLLLGSSGSEKEHPMSTTKESKYTNRLIDSTSPYLLQHAHNPVDWHPWDEVALQTAREEDKPIFLSIGYSACHWCHVMERESFENPETAALMNKYFICIKVDREERPDLDEIYMSAVQAMTGSGGWPMSVFLTPDLKPFFGGTYFPPQDMHGRPGFPGLLKSVGEFYTAHREEINQSAEQLTQRIKDMMTTPKSDAMVDYSTIEHCVKELSNRFDATYGGFGPAPKFPHSMDISLLLRSVKKTGDTKVLQMAEFSLEKMARGGMYDQIGGGFHRYSTDAQWLIPHFEKMLYDNALLAKTYTEAYQLTKNPFYKQIVQETLDYVLLEMTSPEGGFYSAQDADSEGREGLFFSWTPEQITEVVGADNAPIVIRYFGFEKGGNFEEGTSVLHRPEDAVVIEQAFDISSEKLSQIIDTAKKQLFQEREKRIKPGRDEKILTDWNGLMISAMAFAGNALAEPKYTNAAHQASRFILKNLSNESGLYHTYKDGRAHINGFLSDYSFMIHGLLDTYEATRNPEFLKQAVDLTRVMITRFWDDAQGAFFFTSNNHEKLIARSKNPMDNAVPSGNSIAILCLLRISEMTGHAEFREKAHQSLIVFSTTMNRMPSVFTQMLAALDFHLGKPQEIILAANNDASLADMQHAIFSDFYPNKVVLYSHPAAADLLNSLAPVAQGKTQLNGSPTAYVCQDFACRQPVSSIAGLKEQLEH